jgi:hypothetical protein
MNRLATALSATALLALGACGGGEGANQAAADNGAASAGTDNLTLPPNESDLNASGGADLNAAGGDSLGNQLNALGNESSASNAVGNSSASGGDLGNNSVGNAQ